MFTMDIYCEIVHENAGMTHTRTTIKAPWWPLQNKSIPLIIPESFFMFSTLGCLMTLQLFAKKSY